MSHAYDRKDSPTGISFSSRGNVRSHARLLAISAVVVVAAAIAMFAYVLCFQESDVTVSLSAPGLSDVNGSIEMNIVSTDDNGADTMTISLGDGDNSTVRLKNGSYRLSVVPSFPLLSDGTSTFSTHDDMSFDVSGTQTDVAVTLSTFDASDQSAVDSVLNSTEPSQQQDAATMYDRLHKQAIVNSGSNGVSTDEYDVYGLMLDTSSPGIVRVNGTLSNGTGRSMQWAEVNIDILDADGNVIGSARYENDLIYRDASIDFVAEGYVDGSKAAACRVGSVIWY